MNCPTDSLVHIGVVENNVRALPAELERDPRQVRPRCSLHDLAPRRCAAREGDLADVHVFGQCLRRRTVALEDVEDAGREACLLRARRT